MIKNGWDVAYYLILAAILLGIWMNAKNFSTAVGAVDSGVNKTLGTISGSGYKLAS